VFASRDLHGKEGVRSSSLLEGFRWINEKSPVRGSLVRSTKRSGQDWAGLEEDLHESLADVLRISGRDGLRQLSHVNLPVHPHSPFLGSKWDVPTPDLDCLPHRGAGS